MLLIKIKYQYLSHDGEKISDTIVDFTSVYCILIETRNEFFDLIGW